MELHEDNTRRVPEDMKNSEPQEAANPFPSGEVDLCLEEQRGQIAEAISDKEKRKRCFALCSQLFRDFAIAIGNEIDALKKQRDNAIIAGEKALGAASFNHLFCSMNEHKINNTNFISYIISRISGKHAKLVQEMRRLKEATATWEDNFRKNEKDVINMRAGIRALRKRQHEWFQLSKSISHNGILVNGISIDEVISCFNKIKHAINSSQISPEFGKNHEELITSIIEDLSALAESDDK